MYLLTLILGIVLLHEASTLNCYLCLLEETGTCNETRGQCPPHYQCGAVRTVIYEGGSKDLEATGKSCASPEQCGEHSVNYGVSRQVINFKCCTSDLCNNQPAPELSPTASNGKKCFTCDRLTCSSTLDCLGNEDYCITETDGKNATLKGCASKLFCSNTQTARMTRVTETEFSCCQGDYCNGVNSTTATTVASTTTAPTTASTVTKTTRSRGVSASSTSAGLLLLVTPLISLILN